jgi:DNA methylase
MVCIVMRARVRSISQHMSSVAAEVDPLAALSRFRWNGQPTTIGRTSVEAGDHRAQVATFTNEFWTSRQRAAHSLHEISYRACFKPQLPRFFIERLTVPGHVVYDPFMGRGTTVLEAALLGRVAAGCDVNPLSAMLVGPRLSPPSLEAVQARLETIDFSNCETWPARLRVFYHPDTLREICALKAYLGDRARSGALDDVDRWIRMVAVNRLTGHSSGFFSVYTLPPNQALSIESQRRINMARHQEPPRRHVPELILGKSRSLLRSCTESDLQTLATTSTQHRLLTQACASTAQITSGSVDLVVTSPPFLDIVDYASDNWLRGWFCGIDTGTVQLTVVRKVEEWQAAMTAVFEELARVLRPGGHVAFEVGEVRGGRLKLEEAVLPCGLAAGLEPRLIMINAQQFTKTANCWGVSNNHKGTNTNRIVVFRRPNRLALPARARTWLRCESARSSVSQKVAGRTIAS